MARIAIVKVRSDHDVEWQLSGAVKMVLGGLGFGKLRDRLSASQGQPFMPQLTLPFLAAIGQAYNETHGKAHRFELIDDHAHLISLDGFDMVWFTAVTPTVLAVYQLADRARRKGITTVIGGIHATMMPEEAAVHADAVVVGEGETVVSELLADWDRSHALKPLYRGGNQTPLTRLPLPRWSDAQLKDYCPWIVPIQTSRGCRNACRFCSTTRYQGARRRHRPVVEVVEEIKYLQGEGILTPEKTVFFTDNNIVSDTDHRRGIKDSRYAKALFEALIPLNIPWVGQGEINVTDDLELTQLMARSGCISLLVGFETIQQENLSAMGKPCNSVDHYAQQIEILHDHGIALIGCFIFGLDHDGPEVFERTWRFIDKYIQVPQLSMLTPFPGTALFRRMQREKRLLHTDWSKFDITHVVYKPLGMSSEDLESGYRWLLEEAYSYPSILKRAIRFARLQPLYSHPRLSAITRFTSVLAPNIIYRNLALIGRQRSLLSDVSNLTQPLSWLWHNESMSSLKSLTRWPATKLARIFLHQPFSEHINDDAGLGAFGG